MTPVQSPPRLKGVLLSKLHVVMPPPTASALGPLHAAKTESFAVSADGDAMVVSRTDCSVWLYSDVLTAVRDASCTAIASLTQLASDGHQACFAPTGNVLTATSGQNSYELRWYTRDGKLVHYWQVSSPSSDRLAVGSLDANEVVIVVGLVCPGGQQSRHVMVHNARDGSVAYGIPTPGVLPPPYTPHVRASADGRFIFAPTYSCISVYAAGVTRQRAERHVIGTTHLHNPYDAVVCPDDSIAVLDFSIPTSYLDGDTAALPVEHRIALLASNELLLGAWALGPAAEPVGIAACGAYLLILDAESHDLYVYV